MKCPRCRDEGRTSKVVYHGSSVTLMGHNTYYDEDGTYHSHDPNREKSSYSCTRDHFFTIESVRPCPAENCGYGKDDDGT